MQKTLLKLSLFLFLNALSIDTAVGQCDELAIDEMYFDTPNNEIKGQVINYGTWWIVYPYFTIAVDSNVYISSKNAIVPSYLDTVGGIKDGLTPFSFQSTLLMPFDSIPSNTNITGTITIQDPIDTTALCTLPFQWQIRTGSLSVSTKKAGLAQKLNIYPNPASDHLNIDVSGSLQYTATIYDLEGRVILSSTNQSVIELQALPQGIYLLEIKDVDSGQKIVERIVKRQ